MRIAIPALGTEGDVLPYVMLGAGLRGRGHDVSISTTARFRDVVEAAGLRFQQLPGDPTQMFEAVSFDPRRISPWRPLRHVGLIHDALHALVGQVDPEGLLEAWHQVELVIFGPTTTFGAANAERLGVPAAMMALTPSLATGAFAHPVIAPALNLRYWGNRASWLAGERLQRQTFAEPLKPSARTALALPAFPLSAPRTGTRWPPFPVLHAYSPVVVPRPDDWPSHVHVIGWLLQAPSDGPLPAEVERFLEQGEPPVYIGFGSMPIADTERTARQLADALARTNDRAIVSGSALRGAAALQGNESILLVERVAHEKLFPRVSAVVHHGGSSTVGTGLRAGRPTLVLPIVFDQFFWGRRVAALGVGPAPFPLRGLSSERFAKALIELRSERVRTAARTIGARIDAERGDQLAVELIERMMS